MKSLLFLKKRKRTKTNQRRSLIVVRQVTGDSMLPSLSPEQIVIGFGYYKALLVGDMVIVRHGGLEKIKRIRQVQDDRIFVVGDNQAQSTDSRSFGWLPSSAVIAKVFWPKRREYAKKTRQ